jgi:hypothetical protein
VNGKPIVIQTSKKSGSNNKKNTIKTATYANDDLNDEYVNFKPFFVNVLEYSSTPSISEGVLRKMSTTKFRFCDFMKEAHENRDYRWFFDLISLEGKEDVSGFFELFLKNDYSEEVCAKAPLNIVRAFERYFGTMGYFCIFDEYHGIMRSKSSFKRSKIFSMLSFSKESIAMTGTPFANDTSAELLIPFMRHSVKYPINNDNFETTLNNVITSNVVSNHRKNFNVVHLGYDRFSTFGIAYSTWRNILSDFILNVVADGKKNETTMMKSVMLYIRTKAYLDACMTIDTKNVGQKMDAGDDNVYLKGLFRLEDGHYVYKMTREEAIYANDTTIQMRSKNSEKIYDNVYAQMLLLALNEIKKGNRVMLYVRYVDHLNTLSNLLNDYLNMNNDDTSSESYRLVRENQLDFTKSMQKDMKMTFYVGKTSFDYVDSDVETKRVGLVVLPMMQRRGFNMTACNVQVLTYFGPNTSDMEQANGRIDRTDQKSKEITYYHVLNDRLCYEYVKNIVFSQFFE